MRRRVVASVFASTFGWLALGAPGLLHAQSLDVDDFRTDYLRLIQILGADLGGSFTARPLPQPSGVERSIGPWARSGAAAPSPSGVQWSVLPARARVYFNSSHPTGQNDGSVWRGRGLTTAVDAGVRVTWGAWDVTVAPTVWHARNADFDLAPVMVSGMPEYAYPWRRIDLPQRFGPDAVTRADLGQSEVSLRWRGVRAGAGTKNLWWGPARRNPIILSDNAAGFPHGFIGTGPPAETPIGAFEAYWLWGRLAQSEWYDPDAERTERFLTGAVATYSPSFLEGLTVGATRMFYGLIPPAGNDLGDYFAVFTGLTKQGFVTPDNPLGDDEQDQLISLFFRWVLPESGFEVYAEWARNDHAQDVTDFLQEPEHAQAYTLGLQKGLELEADRLLSLWVETTHLERSRTLEARASPVYYAHHVARQGYTHEGQVLGAGIGPGGNSQSVGADLYDGWGRMGLFAIRDVHDNDAYYAWAEANGAAFCCHDVSLRLGGRGTYFVGRFDIGGELVVTRELNRYFDDEAWNVGLAVDVRLHPQPR